MFHWVQTVSILDWCDIRVLLEVLDIVGHDFSFLSSVVLNRIISRGIYKIRDNRYIVASIDSDEASQSSFKFDAMGVAIAFQSIIPNLFRISTVYSLVLGKSHLHSATPPCLENNASYPSPSFRTWQQAFSSYQNQPIHTCYKQIIYIW